MAELKKALLPVLILCFILLILSLVKAVEDSWVSLFLARAFLRNKANKRASSLINVTLFLGVWFLAFVFVDHRHFPSDAKGFGCDFY
jgi:heme/copper-type cytochrome/quinol oxidase subunit 3